MFEIGKERDVPSLRGYRSIAYYCAASFWKDDKKYKEDHPGNDDEKPEDCPPAERLV